MKPLFRFLIFCTLLLGLMVSGGCAAQVKRGAVFSFVAENCPEGQAPALAEAMADSLSGIFPPGHTTLYIEASSPDSGEDALGAAFDQSLRARGFVIAPEPSEQTMTVAYTLDQVDEKTWYTRLSVSGGLVLARTYLLTGEKLTAGAAAMKAGGKDGE